MQQPVQWPDGLQAEASERIPPLNNIAPSIFVPLQDDILESELPRDRVARLKRILETIDCQREGVKENLLYMFEREKKRIIMEAAEIEQTRGPPGIKPGPSPSEVDEMIANMEAPAVANVDYDIRNMADFDLKMEPPPDASLRDRTVLDLLKVVEKGLGELEMFEAYMFKIKVGYLTRLEQEMSRIEDAGKRPEERSGATGG
jgi:hypothetical protein